MTDEPCAQPDVPLLLTAALSVIAGATVILARWFIIPALTHRRR